jgi:type I restriction enzyme S subunit
VTSIESSRWTLATLDKIAHVGAGNPAPQDQTLFEGGKHPFIRTSDVGQIRFGEIGTSADLLNEQGASKLRLVPKGTVLMPKSGASTFLNHRVVTTADAFVSSHLATITPKEGVADPGYLLYALSQVAAQDLLPENSYPSLNLNLIKTIKLPLPSLEEQQRIVEILDEAFEGLARARDHAEANLQNARELFENFLSVKMQADSDDWTNYSFGDPNVLKIVDGDRGANYPKKTDFLSKGHCLFLNTKNVRPDGFDFDETMFISEERDQLLRKGKLLPRDVLLTTRGTIGNIAIFDNSVPYEHIRINSGMLILRPNEDIIRAEFLFELLRSSVIRKQIEEHVSGAAQPQLPIRSLVKFRLPAPKATDEQLVIVEELKQLSVKVSEMAEGYETKLQDIDDLRQSLLQNAFAGELT